MVLVDAGGCPITQKVRNIEKAGGQVAVIGDAWFDSLDDVFMEDVDGSGFSLTTPALLIDRTANEMLKTALQAKMMVKMKATLEISHAESRQVDVGLWYGSTLDLNPKLLQQLFDYQKLIAEFVKFSPHIMTLQCPTCVYEVKEKECLSDGLYCLIPPKDEIGSQYNVTDEGVLWETLYGRCLHETVKDKEPDLLSFFNYLYNVRNTCFKNSFLGFENNDMVSMENIKQCARDQIAQVGVNERDVEQCVDNSFKIAGNNQTDNILFYKDKTLAEIYGMSIHPAITINGQIYRGDLTGEDIFRAVCASFASFKPLQCLQEFNVSEQLSLHNSVKEFVKPSTGRWPLIICLVLAVIFNFGVVYLYRQCQTKQQEQEMQTQVQKHVGMYF